MNKSYSRIMLKIIIFIFFSPMFLVQTDIEKKNGLTEKIKQGIRSGKMAYRLTEPEEVISILGLPEEDSTRKDGGMLLKELRYPGILMIFGKWIQVVKQAEKQNILVVTCDQSLLKYGLFMIDGEMD